MDNADRNVLESYFNPNARDLPRSGHLAVESFNPVETHYPMDISNMWNNHPELGYGYHSSGRSNHNVMDGISMPQRIYPPSVFNFARGQNVSPQPYQLYPSQPVLGMSTNLLRGQSIHADSSNQHKFKQKKTSECLSKKTFKKKTDALPKHSKEKHREEKYLNKNKIIWPG